MVRLFGHMTDNSCGADGRLHRADIRLNTDDPSIQHIHIELLKSP